MKQPTACFCEKKSYKNRKRRKRNETNQKRRRGNATREAMLEGKAKKADGRNDNYKGVSSPISKGSERSEHGDANDFDATHFNPCRVAQGQVRLR